MYPLTRALYGHEVRQPIGGDFGFSGRLASHYLRQPVWETDVARFGIDIWMTTTALADDFRVCQSFLGAKIHDAKDPGADLAAMLVQVVSAVFDLMGTYRDRWTAVEGASGVPLFGFPHGVGLEPVSVNVERMVGIFAQGVRDLGEVWGRALEGPTLDEVAALAAAGRARLPLSRPAVGAGRPRLRGRLPPAGAAARAAAAVAGPALPGSHRLLRAPERARAAPRRWRRRSRPWPTSSCGRSRACASGGRENVSRRRGGPEPC